jgi:hypothetical protein
MARLLVAMGLGVTAFAGRASAEPWSIAPSAGVAADYESNPGLRTYDERAEAHVAAILDAPLRYDADEIELTLRPNGRLSNNAGYDSLASNYVHLDASAQYTADRSSATLQGELARDSSLLFIGPDLNGLGVRRDSAVTAFDWTHLLTEREQLQLDASWSQVKYALPQSASPYLINYHYLSGGPIWSVSVTDRSTLKLNAVVAQYDALDGITSSRSYNPQLELVRQLTEIWSLTATAGYARAINSEKFFYGPFFLGSFKTTENSTTYSATLARQGERFNLSATASRALAPTGLAYLSQLESAGVTASLTQSEYWDYRVNASWQRAVNPVSSTETTTQHYINAQLAVDWHWTPQWILTLSLGRVSETFNNNQAFAATTTSAASNIGMITVTRQFMRTDL